MVMINTIFAMPIIGLAPAAMSSLISTKTTTNARNGRVFWDINTVSGLFFLRFGFFWGGPFFSLFHKF